MATKENESSKIMHINLSEPPDSSNLKEMEDISRWEQLMKDVHGALTEQHEADYKALYPKLVQLRCQSELMDLLHQDGLISLEQCQSIESKDTTQKKMRAILDICMSSERGYYSFVRAKWLCSEKAKYLNQQSEYKQSGSDASMPLPEEKTETDISFLKEKLGLNSFDRDLSIADVIGGSAGDQQSIGLTMLDSLIRMDYRGREKVTYTHKSNRVMLESLVFRQMGTSLSKTVNKNDINPLDALIVLFNC